ncbi:hypothetical protein HYS93_03740 [Candidatus Daviesbacteria bacterium]|nr:hypothetical protein [Candidatus Daviesbacteria bacterium]
MREFLELFKNIDNGVVFHRLDNPGQLFIGRIEEIDTEAGVTIRGVGKKGGEYIATSDLVGPTGMAENKRGSWRFYKLPLTEQAKEALDHISHQLKSNNGSDGH